MPTHRGTVLSHRLAPVGVVVWLDHGVMAHFHSVNPAIIPPSLSVCSIVDVTVSDAGQLTALTVVSA